MERTIDRFLDKKARGALTGGIASTALALKARLKRYMYPDFALARRQYFQRNGFYPDLLQPRDLSEKVLWLKLHDRSPLHTICADKILARSYVSALDGTDLLVPALLVTYDILDIDPDVIRAPKFVVKTNHDQGGIYICDEREAFDWDSVRSEIKARWKRNKYYDYRERQYRDIRPGVIVEAHISGSGNDKAREIKVNCFHGEPRFVQLVLDRHANRRHAIYDPEWRRMPVVGRSTELEGEAERPLQLDRMLAAASRLSHPFLYCRVDFLEGEAGRPWFNEITFHPAAGLVRYRPPEMERAFGDMLDLERFEECRKRQRTLWSKTRNRLRLDDGQVAGGLA